MKIQRTILLILIGAIIALTSFTWLAFLAYYKTITAKNLVSKTYQEIATINRIHIAMGQLESETRNHMITNASGYTGINQSSLSRLDSLIKVAYLLTKDNPLQQKRIDTLQHIIRKRIALNHELLLLHARHANDEVASLLNDEYKGDTVNHSYENVYSSFIDTENEKFLHRTSENRRVIRNAYYVIFLGSLLFLLLLVILLARIRKILVVQRRNAQEEVRKKDVQYQHLIENARVVMYNTNIAGDFQFISNWVYHLTGYSKEELLGKNYSMMVAPECLVQVTDHYRMQIDLKLKESELEFPIVIKDGSRKWVGQLAVLLQDEDNNPIGFQCIVRDIDEHKRMELEMKSLEQRRREYQHLLQAILDNSPSLIFVKDAQSKYLLINKKYEEIFQIKSNDIIGKNDFDFDPPERAHAYQEDDLWVISHRKIKRVVQVLHTPNGARNYLILKFPILNERGAIHGVCGIATDITDQIEREKELETAREKAEVAEKAQELFLANVSHEMRTPLNGILGMSRLLAQTPINGEQVEFVNALEESSETLLLLINDLLDISRIKAGKMAFEQVQFNLKDLLSRALTGLHLRAREKGLALDLHVDSGVPLFIVGDPHRLSQILVNLVGNAVKFTEKGFVRLDVSVMQRTPELVWVRFKVEDSGIGIPKENMDNLFNEFTQMHLDTARKYGGSGLGLALTRQLVGIQNGQLDVQSEVAKGSIFTVTIPYAYDETAVVDVKTTLLSSPEKPEMLNDLYILVVEDNVINQKVAGYTLEKAGAQVKIASNGREAMATLQQGPVPDVILMDLMMPEMDGYETTRAIRTGLKLQIPIIAMTASNMSGEREKSLQAGMNGYISKPFTATHLFGLIQTLIASGTASMLDQDLVAPLAVEKRDIRHYNLSYLEEMDDQQHTLEMLRMFLNTAPRSLQDLEEAIRSGTWDKVYLEAHKLKSSLGLFQMKPMLEYIKQIEQDAKTGQNTDQIPMLMHKAQLEYAATITLLKEEMTKLAD